MELQVSQKLRPGNKRIVIVVLVPVVIFLSGVAAWRALAILGAEASPKIGWLAGWLALTAGLMLFWLAILKGLVRLSQTGSRRHWLAAGLGAVTLSLAGLLVSTPADLSRITLEIYADNVWQPTIFSATWGIEDKNGLAWQAPFHLPPAKPSPASLEIVTAGPSAGAIAGEVWLVDALWPDGTTLPLEQFQAGPGWERRKINWGSYQNKPVWVAASNQPATLAWNGTAPGPLQQAEIIDELPDLSTSLDEFARNINQMIDLAQAQNIRVILMTQPSMWRPKVWFELLRCRQRRSAAATTGLSFRRWDGESIHNTIYRVAYLKWRE